MDKLIPGLEGVPCAESSISFINGQEGVLEYRGYDIRDLAENCSSEEVAYLLIEGALPNAEQLDAFSRELKAHRAVPAGILEMLATFPAAGHPMKALQASVAGMGAHFPMGDMGDRGAQRTAILRLIASVPTVIAAHHRLRNGDAAVAPREDLGHAANFLYMLGGEVPSDVVVRTIDACIVLHMEHTMNASTFTGRVVASTMADPYAVVSAAVGSLTGPLHGGANERALKSLRTIPSLAEVDEIIGGKIDRKEKIMGLGHRVYKTKDPRAYILQGRAEELFAEQGATPVYEIARRVEELAAERLGHKGIYPNVDFYSGIVYDAMGIPSDVFTPIFAVARVVGWLAHWQAQIDGNRIFRPSQVFTGTRGHTVGPIGSR